MNTQITALKGAKSSLITGIAFIAGSYLAPLIGTDQQVATGIVVSVLTGLTTAIFNAIKNRKK